MFAIGCARDVAPGQAEPPALEPEVEPEVEPQVEAEPEPPKAAPTIVLDGVIDAEEWASASAPEPAPSFELKFLRDADLWVGFAAKAYPHICVFDGTHVRVLHASASLGTAVYERDGDGWVRARAFEWAAKDADEANVAAKQRTAYFDAEGWTGTTMGMGTKGQAELRVRIDPATAADAKIAVATFGAGGAATWPDGLSDGCASKDLLMGNPPETLEFQPGTWAALPG